LLGPVLLSNMIVFMHCVFCMYTMVLLYCICVLVLKDIALVISKSGSSWS